MSVCIPTKTSKTVAFPLDEQSNTFEADFYDPDLLNNQISFQELTQFISQMNSHYKLYKQNFAKEDSKSDRFMIVVMSIVILDLLIFFFYPRSDYQSFLTTGEGILLTSISLFFTGLLCGCSLEETDTLSKLKGSCQDLVDQQNETLKSRGLKWHLPEKFPVWIELTKDMEKQNDHCEIAAKGLIPQTTKARVIFPRYRYKSEKKLDEISRFAQDCKPCGDIPREEIQGFLSEINAEFRKPYKVFYKIAFVLFLSLGLELFGLLYIWNHFPESLTIVQTIIILAISGFICFALSGFDLEREDEKRDAQTKLGCQRIVDKYNETLQSREWRWKLPNEFPNWIELCKGSENQELNSQSIEINQNACENCCKKIKAPMNTPLLVDF